MNLTRFLTIIGYQQPLVCIQGDILDTPADHIAFAVHYPDSNGNYNNSGGFAGVIAEKFWPEIATTKFEPGKPISKKIKGKTFHALPVHSNEPNGWDDAPGYITQCLNLLPVDSTEVIATVLIGGGKAGTQFKASVKNLEGLSRTYKTVVLYVKELQQYEALLKYGLVSATIPLEALPRAKKYREIAENIKLIEN